MGIRDEEIKRIVKYSEGLGIKVRFLPFVKGCGGAEWDMITQEINIFQTKSQTKTETIINLLHELGHHLDWIYNNKVISDEVTKAFTLLNEGNIYGVRTDIPKKYRRIIYKEEKAGIEYMSIIHKELDLKLPLWKLKRRQALDLYDYEMLYKKGRFSTQLEYTIYKNEITDKFKKEYK